jgi:NAD dependent epimerase/dehydratase family enzyme
LSLGILGCGYLAKALINCHDWGLGSWKSNRQSGNGIKLQKPFQDIYFDWGLEETWGNLPRGTLPMLLTIPPVFLDLTAEQQRLKDWCGWMRKERSEITRLVYISTTGVYPNLAKHWQESDQIVADTNRGGLRLVTEQVLSSFFKTIILRAGAIYGPQRHLGQRVEKGMVIPQGKQPVHRIHVADLAQVVKLAILADDFPQIVNVVDLDNSPSAEVASWILKNRFYDNPPALNFQTQFYSRKKLPQNPRRVISNRVLLDEIGYKLIYPTYKNGLHQAINNTECQ